MEQVKACAAHFKKQGAFDRCFLLMRKKWESYGRTAGQVVLKDGTPQEQEALEGLLGRSLQKENLCFTLSEFEGALGETRFGAIPLRELLEEYFGEAIEANKNRKQKDKQKKAEFLERMQRELQQEAVCAGEWIYTMREHRMYGCQMLMAEYDRDPERAETLLRQVGRCLEILEKRRGKSEPPIYLAILASQATGNPHALDRGNPAGLLLTHAFCHMSVCSFPDSAQKLSEIFLEHGVQLDEISSTVTAYGIHMETADGLHPAYEGYIKMREPYVITLSNLAQVCRAYGMEAGGNERKPVYIVENEMVFSHLLNEFPGMAISLLCTSGQPRTAAFVLLDLLVKSGSQLFYAGDLDPEGMMIADRLWRRYQDRLCIWHMGREDYRKSMSGERIDGLRMIMLERLIHPTLVETAELVKQEGRAGYQEQLVEELREDMSSGGLSLSHEPFACPPAGELATNLGESRLAKE